MSNVTVREALNQMTENEIQALYSTINYTGRGFSVGEDGQDLRTAAKSDEFTVWHSAGHGDNETLCASNDIGECFLIGDANGAWGVPVEAADLNEGRTEWVNGNG